MSLYKLSALAAQILRRMMKPGRRSGPGPLHALLTQRDSHLG
jgi:hypothetical protein